MILCLISMGIALRNKNKKRKCIFIEGTKHKNSEKLSTTSCKLRVTYLTQVLVFLQKTSHMSLTRHIPNIITLFNLFAGTIAVLYAVEGNLVMAAVFVAVG